MNEHLDFERLEPVAQGEQRPLVSVMIPIYNCAKYLEETLSSVLTQDFDPQLMQIEVVDDGSSDNPEEIVAKINSSRVKFYRREKNGGHTANFYTCLRRSKGIYIHLLHGDDKIKQGFYAKLLPLLEQHDEAGAAFCRSEYIDENGNYLYDATLRADEPGILHSFYDLISHRQVLQTPSIIVKRSVYESIGMFNKSLRWCEDWEMWARIGANYPVLYHPEILASYRKHSSSNTAFYQSSGQSIDDLFKGGQIILHWQKEAEKKAQLLNELKESIAITGLANGKDYLENKNFEAATNNLKKAMHYAVSRKLRIKVLGYYLRSLLGR